MKALDLRSEDAGSDTWHGRTELSHFNNELYEAYQNIPDSILVKHYDIQILKLSQTKYNSEWLSLLYQYKRESHSR